MDDHDLDDLMESTRPQLDEHVVRTVQQLVSATRRAALTDPALLDLAQARTATSPTAATTMATAVQTPSDPSTPISTARLGPRGPGRPRHVTRRRAPLAVAGGVVGVLTLAAAGTVAAYQLSIPPFQTTEQGVTRVPAEIPVDYTDGTGRAWRCHAFLEYRDLHDGDRALVQDYIDGHDWDGFGAAAYAEARAQAPTATGEQLTPVFYDVVDARLRRQAEAALPGTALSGTSISCRRSR